MNEFLRSFPDAERVDREQRGLPAEEFVARLEQLLQRMRAEVYPAIGNGLPSGKE